MRRLISLFLLVAIAFGEQLFVVSSGPQELEAKILEKLFTDMVRSERVMVFILGEKREYYKKNLKRYAERIVIVSSCEKAEIVFVAGELGELPEDCRKKTLFSTKREHLFRWYNCVGAFYWKKGRPNLLLIEERLRDMNIELPRDYRKFIEPQKRVGAVGRT